MSTPDEQEQAVSPTRDLPTTTVPDLPLEAEGADVLEQAAETVPAEHVVARDLPLEAPEADAVEQAHVVHLDEDDRRD